MFMIVVCSKQELVQCRVFFKICCKHRSQICLTLQRTSFFNFFQHLNRVFKTLSTKYVFISMMNFIFSVSKVRLCSQRTILQGGNILQYHLHYHSNTAHCGVAHTISEREIGFESGSIPRTSNW